MHNKQYGIGYGWLYGSLLWALTQGLAAKDLFVLEGQLNINTATHAELMQLPFIGRKKADYILQHRAQEKFTTLDDVRKVKGIGEDVLRAIEPYLTLNQVTNLQYRPLTSAPLEAAPVAFQVLTDQQYAAVLTERLASAKSRIDLCFYVFKTSDSPNNRATQLLNQLIHKAQQGVAVTVTLEHSADSQDSLNQTNTATAKRLTAGGVRVYFDRDDRVTHAKLAVVDAEWVLLGSHNLTHSALMTNHETSVVFHNPTVAQSLLSYMKPLQTPQEP